MTTKSDLELICNYTENSKNTKVTEDDERYNLEIKRKNRDLAIDAILEDKVEEYLKNKSEGPFINPGEETYIGSISPKLKSINMPSFNYIDMDDIWNSIIHKLETLTSSPMVSKFQFQPNITLTNDPNFTTSENNDINSRRILTRITMLSNKIASESYMGPANTIICGLSTINYIVNNPMFMTNSKGKSKGYINGLNVVVSDKISNNKIIVMRTSTKPESGLNVVNNINFTYFMSETPGTWQRCINWFEII